MKRYTLQHRIDIIKKTRPCRTTIQNLVKKLLVQIFAVKNKSDTRCSTTGKNTPAVAESVVENSCLSIYRHSLEFGIS